ncbi:hypothetical protein [Kribbella sp. NPDC051620]|uniref:hypothetical protein n=1 Tax=Kribbella sp. NPDC051620 TaxID=3364120 RepID=UPI00379EA216
MTDVDRLLGMDAVELAGVTFMVIFDGARLGQEVPFGKLRKCLTVEFGKATFADGGSFALDAVELEIALIYGQARVAARRSSGPLVLLPRGLQLLAAPDPVAALREYL